MPDDPEVAGLLALMLLTEARRPARYVDGALVPLGEQDRSRWDRALIAEGHALVRECLARNRPGHYQLMAAVNAVHTDATSSSDTDWSQIATLYEAAVRRVADPGGRAQPRRRRSPSSTDPAVGLAVLEPLALTAYTPWHASRADLLRRLDRVRRGPRGVRRRHRHQRQRRRAHLAGRASRLALSPPKSG